MDMTDESENNITDLEDNDNDHDYNEDEVEYKCNELAIHCSINDSSSYTLKFNALSTNYSNSSHNSTSSALLNINTNSYPKPKYSLGESVTSTFSSDMLAITTEQDDEEEEEEKYPQPLQNTTSGSSNNALSNIYDRSTDNDRQSYDYHPLYKYGGTGFEIWNGRALYTSTQILCKTSVYHDNKQTLIQSMITDGHFRSNMIENIEFKIETRRHSNYAVIQVRGALSVIQDNIKAFNESHGDDGMVILTSRAYKKQSSANRTVIVSGFDILNQNSHQLFTDLFLKFGDLLKDISIGLDRNKDPFGIVTFRNIADAKTCYENGNLIFSGRKLNIHYSKFQFIKDYF
eukprot:CAMPEP_0201572616 /NCGR_PEP_ID=MMETSP0190_2-20130828/15984_1 /ASSEMBLY_ACC=CAM_ASM_000263 /TAXON_ID=37353 /ORGANISM="Rosalina sp." /LENGTH=344 /DNA_ID=CAMNT_0047998611 /DNA_START=308 /DNA_END=1342 /DNA_ORIENTATION=+